jgi:hypothetical protein
MLRNRCGWQRLYNVSCNQSSQVSNFYHYNVTLNLNHIVHARRQDEEEEICYCCAVFCNDKTETVFAACFLEDIGTYEVQNVTTEFHILGNILSNLFKSLDRP